MTPTDAQTKELAEKIELWFTTCSNCGQTYLPPFTPHGKDELFTMLTKALHRAAANTLLSASGRLRGSASLDVREYLEQWAEEERKAAG